MDSDGDDTGGGDSRAVFCGVGGEADRGNPKLSCCGCGDTTECSSPTTDEDNIGRGGAGRGNPKTEDATGGDPKTDSWESTAGRSDSHGAAGREGAQHLQAAGNSI